VNKRGTPALAAEFEALLSRVDGDHSR
jgi:hypothetical protein